MPLKYIIKELLRLAVPVTMGNVGFLLAVVVNTVMVGHYSAADLTYRAASNILFVFSITVMSGFVQGVGIAVANSYGEKHLVSCGYILARAVGPLLVAGLIGFFVHWYGFYILMLLHQPQNVVVGAINSLRVLSFSFFPALIYFVLASFLENIKRPMPVAIVVIIVNIFNVLVGWVFIFGKFGFPAMGSAGSSLATLFTMAFSAILLLVYIVFFMKDRKRFINFSGGFKAIMAGRSHSYLQIGIGVALILGVEDIGFASNFVFAGWISASALAAYSIVVNLFSLSFTVSFGISSASSTLASVYNGRQDKVSITNVAIAGILLYLIFAFSVAIILMLFNTTLASQFTNSSEIAALARPAIYVLCWVIIVDGMQIILSNVLRGMKKIKGATIVQIFSSLIIMIPSSWYFAFHLHLGVTGLTMGIATVSTFIFVVLLILLTFVLKKYNSNHSLSSNP